MKTQTKVKLVLKNTKSRLFNDLTVADQADAVEAIRLRGWIQALQWVLENPNFDEVGE